MTNPPTILDRCPCGQPWDHDADTSMGRDLVPIAAREIAMRGPVVPVTVDGLGTFLVARYYLARHRFRGADVPRLFPELGRSGCLVFHHLPAICCARCGRTSWNPGDVASLFCGKCGWHLATRQG